MIYFNYSVNSWSCVRMWKTNILPYILVWSWHLTEHTEDNHKTSVSVAWSQDPHLIPRTVYYDAWVLTHSTANFDLKPLLHIFKNGTVVTTCGNLVLPSNSARQKMRMKTRHLSVNTHQYSSTTKTPGAHWVCLVQNSGFLHFKFLALRQNCYSVNQQNVHTSL